MTRRVPFTRASVERALKAAVASGLSIARVEIGQDGKIVLVPGPATEVPQIEAGKPNDWDEVLTHETS